MKRLVLPSSRRQWEQTYVDHSKPAYFTSLRDAASSAAAPASRAAAEIYESANGQMRSGLTTDDFTLYYQSVIRSALEYACPVWHSSLSAAQIDRIESVQRRALRIIRPTGVTA